MGSTGEGEGGLEARTCLWAAYQQPPPRSQALCQSRCGNRDKDTGLPHTSLALPGHGCCIPSFSTHPEDYGPGAGPVDRLGRGCGPEPTKSGQRGLS